MAKSAQPDPMFAVLYRWKLKHGCESRFAAAWAQMTRAIRARYGSLGSRLHRAEDGTWYAYAQWPTRKAWEEADGKSVDPEAASEMKACVEEKFFAVTLDVTDDLLVR